MKGSGTPADAVFHVPRASGARVAPRRGGLRRPPLAGALACRRSTTALAAATERRRSAPANALPAAELGRSGCYPLPAAMRLSGFPRRPVIVPAGRIIPEPPGSGGDEPPPAGTVLAPLRQHHPAASSQGEMIRCVTVTETSVKRHVSEYGTPRSPNEQSDIRVCGAALSAAPGIAPLTRATLASPTRKSNISESAVARRHPGRLPAHRSDHPCLHRKTASVRE